MNESDNADDSRLIRLRDLTPARPWHHGRDQLDGRQFGRDGRRGAISNNDENSDQYRDYGDHRQNDSAGSPRVDPDGRKPTFSTRNPAVGNPARKIICRIRVILFFIRIDAQSAERKKGPVGSHSTNVDFKPASACRQSPSHLPPVHETTTVTDSSPRPCLPRAEPPSTFAAD